MMVKRSLELNSKYTRQLKKKDKPANAGMRGTKEKERKIQRKMILINIVINVDIRLRNKKK